MPDFYPAFLNLKGRPCLVVGGGDTANEKAKALLACGAALTVVAPAISPELLGMDVEVHLRRYRSSDLEGFYLAVAATSDAEVNREVFANAEARSIFCNVPDVPSSCSFILPAIHRRGPITVAVSTGGSSPALAQWLRDRFAEQIGFEHEHLAHELRRVRPWVKRNLHTYEERRKFFRRAVERGLE